MVHFIHNQLLFMNPEIITQPTEPTTPTAITKVLAPANQVTSLSKILAAVIFISLPFIGAVIGYRLAGESGAVNTQIVETVPATSVHSLRYIYPADWNEYVTDQASFSKIQTLDNLIIEDESLKDIGQAPYFVALLASTPDYMIFCRLPFEKEGSCHRLFKYTISDHNFTEMTTSNLYNPFASGGVLSRDQTKIALVPVSEGEFGTKIGYIDLKNDTFIQLKTVPRDKSFLICGEVSCGSDIVWIDDDTFQVNVYEYCGAFNECLLGGDEPRVPIEVMEINTDEEEQLVLGVILLGDGAVDYTYAAPDCGTYSKDDYEIDFGDGEIKRADCKGFGTHVYKANGDYSLRYQRSPSVIDEIKVSITTVQ